MKNNFFFSAMLALLAFGLTLTSCAAPGSTGGPLGLAGGPSKSQLKVAAKIQSTPNIEEVEGLENKLIWLQTNAQNGGSYVIELNSDEKITGAVVEPNMLLRRNNSDITITLKGVGANRTISYAKSSFLSYCPSAMFVVGTSVTLVLDNNITLKPESCYMPMVEVKERGTLVMNEGSAIIGSRSQTGGGVYVGIFGTFLMKGGTISGNTSRRGYSQCYGQCAVEYFVDPAIKFGGGGVWVVHNGTFIKTGGTITNNTVEDIRKELLFQVEYQNRHILGIRVPGGKGMGFIDEKGYTSVNGFGSQIYFDGPNPKAIDNTVGPEYRFHFSNGTFFTTEVIDQPQE